MDGINMQQQDYNVCRMTLQNILQTHDLSQPMQVNQVGKDEKDFSEICPDASAAFLGPNLWDEYKTAFIDIDSFLGNSLENGQRVIENLDQNIHSRIRIDENQPHHPPQIHPQPHIHPQPQIQIPPEDPQNMHCQDMVPNGQPSPQSSMDSASMQSSYSEMDDKRERMYSVDCKFSPTDLALATPPGHKHYDPASTVFPDDELKPQPIIKKSRKNFVPDNMKDDKYWARRHKNNIAAKRSREARRLKENQIVLRASYLEKENNTLKEDVIRLQAENDLLKEKIRKYEL